MMQLIEREIETGFTTREKKGGWRGEDVAINSLTTTVCTATDGFEQPTAALVSVGLEAKIIGDEQNMNNTYSVRERKP
jgi:hypothetical protein